MGYLSTLRKALRRRRTLRNANRNTCRAFEALSVADRDDVLSQMRRFRPVDTGHRLIRVGPDFDGGYLVPDDLEALSALYSPGVSDTTGFDLQIAERGIACFLADGTIDAPETLHPAMTFSKTMIGARDGPGVISLENWIASTRPPQGDLLLQMDIEGSEYDVMANTSRDVFSRFRIIVVELHDLDLMLLGDGRAVLSACLDRLLDEHVICHVHPNNWFPPIRIAGQAVPRYLELSLLRRDRIVHNNGQEAEFPHPLDMRNVPDKPAEKYDPFWQV